MKTVLFGLLLTSLLQAQMSHAQLTQELLKDLNRAVVDSTGLLPGSVDLKFESPSARADYLNPLWAQTQGGESPADSVRNEIQLEVIALSLTIMRPSGESSRNKEHQRRLAMHVRFSCEGQTYDWEGSSSDRLDSAETERLLAEAYPVPIGGDYRTAEPGSPRVLLTTLGLFGILAALFFIRS